MFTGVISPPHSSEYLQHSYSDYRGHLSTSFQWILTTQLQCLQESSLHLMPVNTYNTATVFTGVISPPHSSEYLQHSYSVYRGHLSTSFQWILTTQLQCLQGSSFHLIPVNTYNTATAFTGIISPPHSSEYLQHSYSAYRGHLSTSFQWILTTQLQSLQGSSLHLIPVNTYNTATVFTGIISPPRSSEYLQHSYSVYRGHLYTSFQWILTTQLQYLQGSSLHLVPVNTYNTATVYTGVISPPRYSEYLQHSYSIYRDHLSISFQWIHTTQLQCLHGSSFHLFQWILTTQLQCLQGSSFHLIPVNTYNTATVFTGVIFPPHSSEYLQHSYSVYRGHLSTSFQWIPTTQLVFTGVISPPHSSEYLQHSYSVYRGHLSTSFQWILTTQLQCLQGSSLHLVAVNTYNTATVFTGVISPPRCSEYLQHSYSVYRYHLSTSLQWILTTQLQYLQGSSLHLVPVNTYKTATVYTGVISPPCYSEYLQYSYSVYRDHLSTSFQWIPTTQLQCLQGSSLHLIPVNTYSTASVYRDHLSTSFQWIPTTQLQCLQGSSLHLIPVNTDNTATVFTGVISPPHSSEYLQHSYSVYRGHLSTSFQWIPTTQLQCVQGSSLHLIPVNTYNTATVFTGVISPPRSSEYLQHSYSVYRDHLSTSFKWILTTQLQCLQGSSLHLIPVNTYNTATVCTGVISPPHSSEYLQHSYNVYRGHLSTSFQWILTTQLQCLQGSSLHLIPVNTYNTATVFTGVISPPHSSEYLKHSYSVYKGHLSTSFQWILTTQLQCLQGSSLPHSSEYLQHSYSVYRGHLCTSFQWVPTTQLQCLQGSSLHLVPVNTYNTATVFTGVISPPHSIGPVTTVHTGWTTITF